MAAYSNPLIERIMADISHSQSRNASIRARQAQTMLMGGGSSGGGSNPRGTGLPGSAPGGLTYIINPKTGQKIQVAGGAAGKFQALINGLIKLGYPVKNVGGYANRNIAGTNTPSFHSRGLAIDIDPGPNRGGRLGGGGAAHGYFNYNQIAPLLKSLGISWGGLWKNPDPMHFSIGEG
jgi:hypothetical protein